MEALKQILARPLFAAPLRGFEVPDQQRLNAALLASIAVRRQAEPGVKISNEWGWHSENDLFTRQEPSFRALADQRDT